MIKVSVYYPTTPGARFDLDYYTRSHIPMVAERFGAACRGIAVDHGVSGLEPGSPPAFVVQCHLLFDTVAAFQGAFAPHAPAILADIPNYTDIPPVIQLNDVKI